MKTMSCDGSVALGQCLVETLLCGPRVPAEIAAPGSSLEEVVSIILVILVTSGQDDAPTSLLCLASNTGYLDTRDGSEVILGYFRTLLGPALAGKTFAPVTTLPRLLLGHLHGSPDDVVLVEAERTEPLSIARGEREEADTLEVVAGVALVAQDVVLLVIPPSTLPAPALPTLGRLLPLAAALRLSTRWG